MDDGNLRGRDGADVSTVVLDRVELTADVEVPRGVERERFDEEVRSGVVDPAEEVVAAVSKVLSWVSTPSARCRVEKQTSRCDFSVEKQPPMARYRSYIPASDQALQSIVASPTRAQVDVAGSHAATVADRRRSRRREAARDIHLCHPAPAAHAPSRSHRPRAAATASRPTSRCSRRARRRRRRSSPRRRLPFSVASAFRFRAHRRSSRHSTARPTTFRSSARRSWW